MVAEVGLLLGDDLLPTIGAGVRRLPNRFGYQKVPVDDGLIEWLIMEKNGKERAR